MKKRSRPNKTQEEEELAESKPDCWLLCLTHPVVFFNRRHQAFFFFCVSSYFESFWKIKCCLFFMYKTPKTITGGSHTRNIIFYRHYCHLKSKTWRKPILCLKIMHFFEPSLPDLWPVWIVAPLVSSKAKQKLETGGGGGSKPYHWH